MDFAHDRPITRDELDQMQQNLQWVYENTPRGRYVRANKTVKDTSLVIFGGMAHIPGNRNKNGAYAYVRFSTAFSPSCVPLVTTSVVVDWTKKIHCVVTGPNGTNTPTSGGFDIRVKTDITNKKKDYLQSDLYVHWIAMGFREGNINEF